MKGSDKVHLMYMTGKVTYQQSWITRKEASDIMQGWFSMKENIRNKGEGWEKDKEILEMGVLAISYPGESEDGKEEVYGSWVFAWSAVLGLYIKDVEDDKPSPLQERSTKAIEKMVDIVEKETKKGEEWRIPDDEGR